MVGQSACNANFSSPERVGSRQVGKSASVFAAGTVAGKGDTGRFTANSSPQRSVKLVGSGTAAATGGLKLLRLAARDYGTRNRLPLRVGDQDTLPSKQLKSPAAGVVRTTTVASVVSGLSSSTYWLL